MIHIDRPLEESIASLKRRSAAETGLLRISGEQAEAVQQRLWERKTAFLSEVQHLTVEFDRLLVDPNSQVSGIVEYLELPGPAQQVASAVTHIGSGRESVA